METATKPFGSFARNGIIIWEEYHHFWPQIGNGDLKRPTPPEQCDHFKKCDTYIMSSMTYYVFVQFREIKWFLKVQVPNPTVQIQWSW